MVFSRSPVALVSPHSIVYPKETVEWSSYTDEGYDYYVDIH